MCPGGVLRGQIEAPKCSCNCPSYVQATLDKDLELFGDHGESREGKVIEKGSEVWVRFNVCAIHSPDRLCKAINESGTIMGRVQYQPGWDRGNYSHFSMRRAPLNVKHTFGRMLLEEDGFQNWENLVASASWEQIQDMNFKQVKGLFTEHGIVRKNFSDRQKYLFEYSAVSLATVVLIQLYGNESEEGLGVKCIDLSGNEVAAVSLHPTIDTALALRSAIADSIADVCVSPQITLPDGRMLSDVDDAEPVRQVLGLMDAAATE